MDAGSSPAITKAAHAGWDEADADEDGWKDADWKDDGELD